MVYNEKLKANTYRWREANPEKAKAVLAAAKKRYYEKNKERLQIMYTSFPLCQQKSGF
jgi:hypothetical protein